MQTDFRYLVGLGFVADACAMLYLHLPLWACFPAAVGVYILGSKLWDELHLE